MKHKHRWQFRGIISAGHRLGMAHRMCLCTAELYQPATKTEFKQHDPNGEISAELLKRAQS